jgi:glycine dehydrogenase subunit 1
MTETQTPDPKKAVASEGGHRYLPIGEVDQREMLEAIGAASIEDLFASLPEAIRLQQPVNVAGPLSDQELRSYLHGLEERNQVAGRNLSSFLGAGAYRHDSPAVIDSLITRSEFLTVYTPYQPEVSQGTLQAIFEFQTFMSLLTGLPVANASLYEGASALAEAALMAYRVQRKRHKVIVAGSIHPHYRATLDTYAKNLEDLEVVEVGWDATGRVDLEALEALLDDDTAAVAVQSPNHFGVVEGWSRVSEVAHKAGALSIGVVAEALSMALLQSPGDGGCDIAVGEAQSFGLPVSFGGPYLGFMAARDEYKRSLPGRLAGQTVDALGKRAFVLTLATREQHIRREKATSNICTNQALCALAATIYLSLHGKVGLRRLAEINLRRATTTRRRLAEAGFPVRFDAPCFNEFAVRSPRPVPEVLAHLEARGILGGVPLGGDYPDLEDTFLVAVTECNQPAELDRLVAELATLGGK